MLKRYLINLHCIIMIIIWILIPVSSFFDFINPIPTVFLQTLMFTSLAIQTFFIKQKIDEKNSVMFVIGTISFLFMAMLLFDSIPNLETESTAYKVVLIFGGIISIIFYSIFLDENIKKHRKDKPRNYKTPFQRIK